jgi:hypothetical protein
MTTYTVIKIPHPKGKMSDEERRLREDNRKVREFEKRRGRDNKKETS